MAVGGKLPLVAWNGAEVVSALVDVNKAPVPALHEAVSGKSVKTIEPVGLVPPLRVAVSCTCVPTTPPADAAVPMVGAPHSVCGPVRVPLAVNSRAPGTPLLLRKMFTVTTPLLGA